MPLIHSALIVITAIAIQVFIVFVARREIAQSEVAIYSLLFSMALTNLYAYIALKAKFENQSLRTVAVNALKPTAVGVMCGGVFAAVCAISYFLTEDVVIYANAVTGQTLVKSCLFSLLPAILEETIFRGVLLNLLRKATRWLGSSSTTIANVVQALVFSASHFNTPQFQEHLYPISVFAAGMIFGHVAIKTRSLWLPMGFHLAWNFSNYLLFGIHKKLLTPESGLFYGYINGAKFIEISILFSTLILSTFFLIQRQRNIDPRVSSRND